MRKQQQTINQQDNKDIKFTKSGQRVDSYIQYRVRKRIQSS